MLYPKLVIQSIHQNYLLKAQTSMPNKTITVSLDRLTTDVDRKTFMALFDSSVVNGMAEYIRAADQERITFDTLVRLARKADIPYSLFFAPFGYVEEQIARKTKILLGGVSKDTFSLNSRGAVKLQDIELIIKDILRKQMLLKRLDKALPGNDIIGCLKGHRGSTTEQADFLRNRLDIDLALIATLNKDKTFEYLVERLETKNVFVSQSVKQYMPQVIQASVRFSGICVRDKNVPYIFMNNRDESRNFEPNGRKVLTLVLLGVCLARAKFSAVSYDEQSKELISNQDYELAEEILMPWSQIVGLKVSSIDDVKTHSAIYSVTPSALLMRLRRLNIVTIAQGIAYLEILRKEFEIRDTPFKRQAKPVNALKKYNSAEYSRAIMRQLDAGTISAQEVTRVLFQNKLSVSSIPDFRDVL